MRMIKSEVEIPSVLFVSLNLPAAFTCWDQIAQMQLVEIRENNQGIYQLES